MSRYQVELLIKFGHIRPALIFLAVLLALPVPIIWVSDAERGREDTKRMAEHSNRWNFGDNELQFCTMSTPGVEGLMEYYEWNKLAHSQLCLIAACWRCSVL